jgi:hypothetical protein
VIHQPTVLREAMRLCTQCSHGHRVALLEILINAFANSSPHRVIISLTSQFIDEIEMLVQMVCDIWTLL